MLRPGQFGKCMYVPLLAPSKRGMILKAFARKYPVDASVNLIALGQSVSCENFSGADLAELVNEAAMAARQEKRALGRKQPSEVVVSIHKHVIILKPIILSKHSIKLLHRSQRRMCSSSRVLAKSLRRRENEK